MEKTWKNVRDYCENTPPTIDTESSPTTVYLNRNIIKRSIPNNASERPDEHWEYEQLALSLDEYEEFKSKEEIFLSPVFKALIDTINEQRQLITETQLNTEYSICLQELSIETGTDIVS